MSKKAPGFVLQKRATFWFIKIPMVGSSMDLVIFQQDFDFRVQPRVQPAKPAEIRGFSLLTYIAGRAEGDDVIFHPGPVVPFTEHLP